MRSAWRVGRAGRRLGRRLGRAFKKQPDMSEMRKDEGKGGRREVVWVRKWALGGWGDRLRRVCCTDLLGVFLVWGQN